MLNMLRLTMRTAVLFVIFISSLESFKAEEPSIYVQVSWDMSWRRFCYLIPLFGEKLSEELYEMDVVTHYEVTASRVRFMNDKTQCEGKGSSDDAVLDFFVSKSETELGPSDVHRNITILAYTILYDYWRNKKMILLDAVFLGKVNKVELMGKDKPDISEPLTEEARVAIGIVVGLTIAFTIAIIFLCLAAKRQIKVPLHGVPLNDVPSEPRITMVDNPAAYDLYGQDDRHDGFARQSDLQDGFAKQNGRQDGFARQDDRHDEYIDSYNGYAVQNNTKYDDEPLGSTML